MTDTSKDATASGSTVLNDAVLLERRGSIVTWTLNRPEARNPISEPDVIDALVAAVDDVNADESVRAVILTGAGSGFSSGGNVKHMRDRKGMFGGSPGALRQGYRHGIQRIPKALYWCEVPVIAAVNGPAIGAGCDLALMCDIRIASENAVFAESFVKVGIVPGDGGSWLLPRAIGTSRAAQMAFTGATIPASRAEEWGLVSEVVAHESLLDRANEIAETIEENPPQVVRMTKRLLREGQFQSLEAHLELAAAMQAIAHHTEDHQEAVGAMLEKRTPRFTGS